MGTKTLNKKTLLLRERLKESLEQTKRRQMQGHVAPSVSVSVPTPEVTSSATPAPPEPHATALTSEPKNLPATGAAPDAANLTPLQKISEHGAQKPAPVFGPETRSDTIAAQNELPLAKPAVAKPDVPALEATAPAVAAPAIPPLDKSPASTKNTSSKPVAKTPASSTSSNILSRLPKSTRTSKADAKPGNETTKKTHDPADKRFSRRKTTDLAGYVSNNGSTIKIPVIINDLSATGARFTLDRDSQQAFNTTPAIAEKFQLYIIYDRMYVSCRTQWRDGNSYGVRYLSAPKFF